ncbi:MAG: RecX family transcriptional regulator, partial [Rhodocyclaceae bacterium]|nr:RecX family transcriptional regulator [Rhodocyclaceae bacterium]
SDRRFAESWVRSKAARFGAARLRHDLLAKGVAAELVEAVLAETCTSDEGDEAARARALWQHRFGQPATDVRERAKQARFLQGRGFSSAVIGGLLREVARA